MLPLRVAVAGPQQPANDTPPFPDLIADLAPPEEPAAARPKADPALPVSREVGQPRRSRIRRQEPQPERGGGGRAPARPPAVEAPNPQAPNPMKRAMAVPSFGFEAGPAAPEPPRVPVPPAESPSAQPLTDAAPPPLSASGPEGVSGVRLRAPSNEAVAFGPRSSRPAKLPRGQAGDVTAQAKPQIFGHAAPPVSERIAQQAPRQKAEAAVAVQPEAPSQPVTESGPERDLSETVQTGGAEALPASAPISPPAPAPAAAAPGPERGSRRVPRTLGGGQTIPPPEPEFRKEGDAPIIPPAIAAGAAPPKDLPAANWQPEGEATLAGNGGPHTVPDTPLASPSRPVPLAFAGRLVPLPEKAAMPPDKPAANASPAAEPAAPPAVASAAGSGSPHTDRGRRETAAADPARKATADAAFEVAQPSPEPAAGGLAAPADLPCAVHASAQPEALAAAAPRETPPAAPAPPAPPAPSGPAREIRLQFASTGQRVEVSLAERAGELRVAVRTPDGGLAQALRDHLPVLSARLEQSGFHADSWRASEIQAGVRPAEGERATGGAQEGRQHPGGQRQPQQDREQARDPRESAGGRNRNRRGKEFAWLMPPEP